MHWLLLLILAQTPVVTNPTASQTITQPSGTYLMPNRVSVTQVFTLPSNPAAPAGSCRNGSVYLQQTSSPAQGILWRCIQQHWSPEVIPLSARVVGDLLLGINPMFTVTCIPVAGSMAIYRNGIRQMVGADYTITGAMITFLPASQPQVGDILQADYSTTQDSCPIGIR